MSLNASAENGASSDAGRSMSVSSFAFGSSPVIGGHVERRREVIHDGVEQRLHALVLERRAADDDDEGRSVPPARNASRDAAARS